MTQPTWEQPESHHEAEQAASFSCQCSGVRFSLNNGETDEHESKVKCEEFAFLLIFFFFVFCSLRFPLLLEKRLLFDLIIKHTKKKYERWSRHSREDLRFALFAQKNLCVKKWKNTQVDWMRPADLADEFFPLFFAQIFILNKRNQGRTLLPPAPLRIYNLSWCQMPARDEMFMFDDDDDERRWLRRTKNAFFVALNFLFFSPRFTRDFSLCSRYFAIIVIGFNVRFFSSLLAARWHIGWAEISENRYQKKKICVFLIGRKFHRISSSSSRENIDFAWGKSEKIDSVSERLTKLFNAARVFLKRPISSSLACFCCCCCCHQICRISRAQHAAVCSVNCGKIEFDVAKLSLFFFSLSTSFKSAEWKNNLSSTTTAPPSHWKNK